MLKKKWFWMVVAALVAVAVAAWFFGGGDGTDETTPVFTVAEGPLTIGITASGSVQSRDKVVLRSELEGRNTILWVVEDGVSVKTGDLLVEFDAAALVEKRNDQEITANTAHGNLIIAEERLEVTKGECEGNLLEREVTLDLAKMALEKYEKGDFPEEKRQREADIALADEELQRAAEKLDWSRKLAKEGFLTRTELQADELALRRKQIDLEMAKTKMNVLTNYTVHQQRATLQSDVRKATRAVTRTQWQNKSQIRQGETEIVQRSREYYRATNRLAELNFQISKSKIYAPTNGIVLYSSTAKRRWWENPLAAGESAVQRQELIYIPLDEGMIIEIMVPEASLNKLEAGMAASVKVDAFPDQVFNGKLSKIGILPDAQSTRLNPDLKMFKCELECDFRDAVVRPGMSCDIELVKETYAKAVYCPIQCVVRMDGDAYVYVQDGSAWVPRKVEVGLDNNRMIHILKGVEPGEVIMTAPPVQEEKEEEEKDGKKSDDRGSGST
ncbi:MAG: HlyD family efflux transporter periplasmic adaptor subunit [Kiritimatiellae bacterium]|nr:HlyD family efflux transporter periplasmic adaptor subunit [Kiritimatiellia bacterium]MBR6588033.1 HlyD family efflux transporter periplasmic adaptor subunit [Kiritimatiellia bacterium]